MTGTRPTAFRMRTPAGSDAGTCQVKVTDGLVEQVRNALHAIMTVDCGEIRFELADYAPVSLDEHCPEVVSVEFGVIGNCPGEPEVFSVYVIGFDDQSKTWLQSDRLNNAAVPGLDQIEPNFDRVFAGMEALGACPWPITLVHWAYADAPEKGNVLVLNCTVEEARSFMSEVGDMPEAIRKEHNLPVKPFIVQGVNRASDYFAGLRVGEGEDLHFMRESARVCKEEGIERVYFDGQYIGAC